VTVAVDSYNQPLWVTYSLPENLPDFPSLEANATIITPNSTGMRPAIDVDNLAIQSASQLQAYEFLFYDSTGRSLPRYVIPGIPVIGTPKK
jgi:hypothetical protein